MARYVIEYKGGSIELPQGETVVGRGLACRIRFNDPAVSRRHLALRVLDDGISAEDLNSTNPSRLNGSTLPEGRVSLQSDDIVELGNTWFRVALVSSECDEEQTFPGADELEPFEEPVTPNRIVLDPQPPPQHKPSPRPAVRARSAITASSHTGEAPPVATGAPATDTISSAIAATTDALSRGDAISSQMKALPKLETQNCPRCRAKVSAATDECPSCQYRWPSGRPTSVTLRLDMRSLERARQQRQQRSGPERRGHPRVPVDLPVIYDSELLTFDAVARDVSFGGLFIATELLDDVGTRCTVTVLPDGAAAIPVTGVVARTVTSVDGQAPERGGKVTPPGMGIQFANVGGEAKVWLDSLFHDRP